MRNRPRIAVAYMLAASLLLVGMDGLVKWLADDRGYHVTQIAFLRYFVCIFIALGLARMSPQGLGGLHTRRLRGHLWRSVCNLITMLTFYVSLQLIPLPNAVSIGLAAPIFMTMLSIPLLGEKVGPGRWVAVGAGFVGILLIMRPEGDVIEWGSGSVSALVSAVFWAFTLVSSRQLSSSESTYTILFYYALTVVIVLGIAMFWFWRTPPLEDALLFLAVGIAGTCGQFCLNQAFRYGEVSMLAPLDYTGLVWAMILGALIWGDWPTTYMLAGSGIVIACCLYILRSGKKPAGAQTD